MDQDKPFVTAAFICERVLLETDKVVSVVRIVDTFYAPPIPPQMPKDFLPTFGFTVYVIVKRFRPETALVKHEAKLVLHTPSGKPPKLEQVNGATVDFQDPVMPFTFQATEPDAAVAVNLVVRVNLPVGEYGNYWFELLIDGESAIPIPFRLLEQRSDAAQGQ